MSDDDYHGPERRHGVTEERVELMIDQAMDRHLGEFRHEVLELLSKEFDRLEKVMKSAFPDGDPHGHKLAHMAQIDAANRWKDLRHKFILNVGSAGLLAGLTFLCYAAWEAVRRELER